MKTKEITVHGKVITVPDPLSLDDLKIKVENPRQDIFLLARRAWEQNLRIYLMRYADAGEDPEELSIRADRYVYHTYRR